MGAHQAFLFSCCHCACLDAALGPAAPMFLDCFPKCNTAEDQVMLQLVSLPCPCFCGSRSLHPPLEGLQLCDAYFSLLYHDPCVCACALSYPLSLSPQIPDRDCGYSWRIRPIAVASSGSSTCTCVSVSVHRDWQMTNAPQNSYQVWFLVYQDVAKHQAASPSRDVSGARSTKTFHCNPANGALLPSSKNNSQLNAAACPAWVRSGWQIANR